MGVQKNATYKVHNGTDFDEINFKTIASQVKTDSGNDVEIELEKSKIEGFNRQAFINGNFDVWQRGSYYASQNGYMADRWVVQTDGTITRNITPQVVVDLVANRRLPVLQSAVQSASGQTYSFIEQKIEDVTRFFGKWTLSFWVYSTVAYTCRARIGQNFGIGGSSQKYLTEQNKAIPANTWTKVIFTFDIPTVLSSTIGASNFLLVDIFMPINAAHTFKITQIQLNEGDTALPFLFKTWNEEYKDCARYFYRIDSTADVWTKFGAGLATGSASAEVLVPFMDMMRVPPTMTTSAISTFGSSNPAGAFQALTGMAQNITTNFNCSINISLSNGLAAGQFAYLQAANNKNAWINFDAEL